MKRKLLTIISPAFNEKLNLLNFVKKVNEIKKKILGYDLNLVVIDDGSTDGSINELKKIEKKFKFLNYISFTKNFGQQPAIFSGLENFVSDYYVIIDSDLQQDPIEILKMIKIIEKKKIDIIQMKKINFGYETTVKTFFSKFFYFLFSKITQIKIDSGSSDFYLISKRVRDKIISTTFSNNFLRGFLHWSGYSKIYLEYKPTRRKLGTSNYNFSKQINFGLTGFFNYQKNFFLFLFFLSILVMTSCFAYVVYLFLDYYFFANSSPAGWRTIVVLLLFFSSINLFINSIMIYLVTILFDKISKKPSYIINEKI